MAFSYIAVALAGALTFAVRVNEINGRPGPAEAASLEAITILESYPVSADLAAAVSQRAWLMKMRGDGPRAVEIAERAIELAEETGDEPNEGTRRVPIGRSCRFSRAGGSPIAC